MHSAANRTTPISPALWARTLDADPILDRSFDGLVPASIRRWQGIDPAIDQFALDHHFISVHLGGAKRLSRHGEGRSETREVQNGAHSMIPAGTAFQWDTAGPIDFAHIYFSPRLVDQVVERAFDRDPAHVRVHEHLGSEDPLIRALACDLLREIAEGQPQQAYLDDLLHLLLCRALRLHSNARHAAPTARHSLAPYRLRRALDFIETSLGKPIGVIDIAGASGVSRFHFSRAFQRATGKAPYAYLLHRRIAAAKALLINSDRPLAEIGAACGFASPSQFSRMFKREVGASPGRFRDAQ